MSGIIAAIALGFVIGGLGRFAVPGPDPMPFWLTVLIGLMGSGVGLGISAAIFGGTVQTGNRGRFSATLLLEIAAASLLVVAYRRFIQERPITGPEAYQFPKKGYGIARMRQRLTRLGVNPDALGGQRGGRPAPAPEAHDDVDENLRKLSELHRAGVLTDEEYRAKVDQLTKPD